MNALHNISFVLFMLVITPLIASEEEYLPNTGDTAIDESLQKINNKFKKNTPEKISRYSLKLANEFQIPEHKVEELFNVYEFTAADVLISVSIADVSGQPLKNVTGLYSNNKKVGWKAVFKQLKITPGSKVYEQIKKDISAAY